MFLAKLSAVAECLKSESITLNIERGSDVTHDAGGCFSEQNVHFQH